MEGVDTQEDYPLELNEYISGLYPDELQVDHYLNLATASGSRYVFRVVSKDIKNAGAATGIWHSQYNDYKTN